MIDSVLEYMITDKFIYLLLTSERFQTATKHTGIVTVYKNQFDQEVVEILDDDLGTPDTITCMNPQYNIIDGLLEDTSNGRSFTCDRLEMTWHDQHTEKIGILYPNRSIKPASIVLTNFNTMHNNGIRTSFSVGLWEVRWYKSGVLYRNCGPHSIIGKSPINAAIDTNGTARILHPLSYDSKWRHPSDGRDISQARINEALVYHDIILNELSKTDKVFSNSLDMMAFYATV